MMAISWSCRAPHFLIVVTTVERLCCNSCGAPLDVPESAAFVKCNHCGQQLAVRRSETVTFTEAVERFAESAETLSEQLEALSLQNRLAELDRRWERQREEFMIADKHGNRHLPDETNALTSGIGTVIFGCVWIAIVIGITSGGFSFGFFDAERVAFTAIGVVIVVLGLGRSLRNFQKARDYRAALHRYEMERNRITSDEAAGSQYR